MIVLTEENRSGLEIYESSSCNQVSAYENTQAEDVGRQKRNKEGALSAPTEI